MPVNTRFPRPLIEKIDAFARQESKATGFPINRSQALRRLVEIGLDTQTPRGEPKKPTATFDPVVMTLV